MSKTLSLDSKDYAFFLIGFVFNVLGCRACPKHPTDLGSAKTTMWVSLRFM